jgi:hypothetical protein
MQLEVSSSAYCLISSKVAVNAFLLRFTLSAISQCINNFMTFCMCQQFTGKQIHLTHTKIQCGNRLQPNFRFTPASVRVASSQEICYCQNMFRQHQQLFGLHFKP